MDIDVIAAQNEVAQLFMRQADPRWEHILVNVELKQFDEGLYSNVIAFAIGLADGDYVDESIPFHEATTMPAVVDLRDVMARASGQAPWLGMELTIDPPGQYRMTFSYEPGRRIAGIYDHESYYRFKPYIREWAAQRVARAPPR